MRLPCHPFRPLDQIRNAIQKAAVEVFKEYRANLFPMWDEEYEAGFDFLHCNLLYKADVDAINQAFSQRYPQKSAQKNLIAYLHSVGLIGVPDQDVNFQTIQKFWSSGEVLKPMYGTEPYVLLRPAFSSYLYEKLPPELQPGFFNRQMLIYPEQPCLPDLQPPMMSIQFHQQHTFESSNQLGRTTYRRAQINVRQGSTWVCLVSDVTHPEEAFLLVLVLALRMGYEGFFRSPEQLQEIAWRLLRMGYLPSKVSDMPDCWIHCPCNDIKTAEVFMSTAKRALDLLKDRCPVSPLTIQDLEQQHNSFCLWKISEADSSPLKFTDVVIEGLNLDDYHGAISNDVKKPLFEDFESTF